MRVEWFKLWLGGRMKVKGILLVSCLLILALGMIYSYSLNQSIALCKPSETSTPYCKYIGPVNKLYVNQEGLVLLFLNVSISTSDAAYYGYNIRNGSAFAVDLNSPHGHEMYELIRLAFTNGDNVEVHARATTHGYMLIDRVWIM